MGNAKNIPKDKDTLFLPYQAEWIRDDSRLKLMEKSRQIGLSWASAYRQVKTTSPRGARYDQWVSSRDEIQARLFLEDCKAFAEILNVAARDLGEVVIDPEKKLSAFVVRFANSRRIHSMSSNPNAQAGKRGGRVLDEFALHPDPKMLYSIAYPGITWGGNLEIFSSHRGTQNFFARLCDEIKHGGNPKSISHHKVTLQDALDCGFLFKLQSKLPADDERQDMDEAAYFDYIRSGCADEEQFLQEYMCVPADDETAFLTYDDIAACEYALSDEWEIGPDLIGYLPNSEFYLGVDVGRKKDLTVIWVLERVLETFFTRSVIALEKRRFAEQEAVLYELLDLPQIRRCCIDNTGLGMQFTERAQEKYGDYRVEAVTFTNAVKEALAYPVRHAFEERAIKVPNEGTIRKDLRSIKKVVTAAGNVRFDADRSEDGHADRFWALALALHAGQKPAGRPEYETVTERTFTKKGAFG
ncbi:MAG: hypothetical protein U5L07_07805 [Desulfobacterales bacterium]|nr:hypothetical protein [Desulfobacterales bacterium]